MEGLCINVRLWRHIGASLVNMAALAMEQLDVGLDVEDGDFKICDK